ncbi:hypothetical protein WKI65_25830 [Streptomyces sp. MS1.AVA.3]|uniref:hypothetical protein n=1 Tax=Streptomyces decoyicus TaxID=249567 RepID=UPI0030C5D3DF
MTDMNHQPAPLAGRIGPVRRPGFPYAAPRAPLCGAATAGLAAFAGSRTGSYARELSRATVRP